MSDGSDTTSKKNPVAVFIGLALVGGLGLLGVTREQWLPQLTGEQAATLTAEQPSTTTAEQPATTTAEQPAAETTEQAATTTAEQPATAADAVKIVPTFDTVRIEKGGEAVIAGRAEPGANVTVKLGDAVIGSATANADGSFVVVPEQTLPAGSGALTIEAKAGDGAAVASEQSVAVIIPEKDKEQSLVAVVSPTEPTKVLQKPATATGEAAPAAETTELASAPAQISIDSVDYDEAGNIVFSGNGAPGAAARIYVDNALAGEVKAGDDGRWTFSGTQIATGTHTLRADSIAADGSVASRAEVPFFREERTKVATAETGEAATEQAADAGAAATADTGAATTDTGAATTTADAGATTTAESGASTTADAGAATTAESGTTTAETGTTTTETGATTTAEATGPKEGRVVIQPGNNLWRISRVIYGTGMKYTVLYEANRDQIRDPDLIYPGQVFKTPDVVPPESIDPKRRQPLTPEEGASNP